MPPDAIHPVESLPPESLARLVVVRWSLLAIECLATLVAQWLVARLPWAPMLAIIALHGLLNLTARRRTATCTAHEVFLQLATDAAALAALIYFSGGYANPFIFLLLLPLLLCAVTLGRAQAWAMAIWVALLYSLLARHYQPLALTVSDRAAIDLHLIGMWLNFLLTALLVTAFVARLAGTLKARGQALAEARERALRDEHLFALGMQSAAAAHDLATPLSALMITLRELQREYAGDDELERPLTQMRTQAERLRATLDRLAVFARPGERPRQALDAWATEAFEHWRLMRPQIEARLTLAGSRAAPTILADPMLTSLLATLLNNAADVSPHDVALNVDWDGESVRLTVADRGPGLAAYRPKPDGWGVGLQLARAALQRLGGHLTQSARTGGGLSVVATLPLATLARTTP